MWPRHEPGGEAVAALGVRRTGIRHAGSDACRHFGTVLGPDYNGAHRDHLHLEHGPGRLCR